MSVRLRYRHNKLKKIFTKYHWPGRRKLAHNLAIQPISKGGLSFVDLNLKIDCLKLSWICRLFQNLDSFWAQQLASFSHVTTRPFPIEHISTQFAKND